MFSAFLSKDMTYSCAIFTDLDGDLLRSEEIGETNGGLGLMKFGKGKGSKKAIKANGNHARQSEEAEEEDIDELEEAQLRKIR
jgi:cyclopropane-fatty-acyl-phospholipid synthase